MLKINEIENFLETHNLVAKIVRWRFVQKRQFLSILLNFSRLFLYSIFGNTKNVNFSLL